MYFIAHVDIWDETENDYVEYKILFFANDYPDATQVIIDFFGESNIERITLLEAITDNSVIVINNEVEKYIREEPINGF